MDPGADELFAAEALARGLVTPAQLEAARRRLAVLRQAGLPSDLLEALQLPAAGQEGLRAALRAARADTAHAASVPAARAGEATLAPAPELGTALAATDRAVLLFGGASGKAPRQDTWTWEGAAWSQLLADVHRELLPPPRQHHALAWDARRRVVVLFGGYNDGVDRNDTWELGVPE